MERGNGYRTKQKEQIYAFMLENRQRHVTANEIALYLSAEGTPVGVATIYRYLDKLVEQQEIRKYVMDEKSGACYQYVGADPVCNAHFHLKCVRCHTLIHTDCDYLQELDQHIFEHHGFRVDQSKTVLYGICAACAAKEETR